MNVNSFLDDNQTLFRSPTDMFGSPFEPTSARMTMTQIPTTPQGFFETPKPITIVQNRSTFGVESIKFDPIFAPLPAPEDVNWFQTGDEVNFQCVDQSPAHDVSSSNDSCGGSAQMSPQPCSSSMAMEQSPMSASNSPSSSSPRSRTSRRPSADSIEAILNSPVMHSPEECGGNFKESSKPWAVFKIQPQQTGHRFRYNTEGKCHGSLSGKQGTSPTLAIYGLQNETGRLGYRVELINAFNDDPHPNVLTSKVGLTPLGHFQKELDYELKPGHKKEGRFEFSLGKMAINTTKKTEVTERLINLHKFRYCEKHGVDENHIPVDFLENLQKKFPKAGKPDVDASQVRMRISVWIYAGQDKMFLEPVISDIIKNEHHPNSNKLVISKLSHSSCSKNGQKEIIILCSKVCKESIQVRFEETDKLGTPVWAENVGPSMVHHQCAIVIHTPRYNHTTEGDVEVDLRLVRNNDFSEARKFVYKAQGDSRKRKYAKGSNNVRPSSSQTPSTAHNVVRPALNAVAPVIMSPQFYATQLQSPQPGLAQPVFQLGSHPNGAVLFSQMNNQIPMTQPVVSQVGGVPTSEFSTINTDDWATNVFLDSGFSSGPRYTIKEEPLDVKPSSPFEEKNRRNAGQFAQVHCPRAGMVEKQCREKHSQSITKDAWLEMQKLSLEETKAPRYEEAKSHVLQNEKSKKNNAVQEYATSGDPSSLLKTNERELFAVDDHGNNNLHLAINYKQNESLNHMLSAISRFGPKKDLAVNARNHDGLTPLHFAVTMKQTDSFESLLRAKADVTKTDGDGNNVIHLASALPPPFGPRMLRALLDFSLQKDDVDFKQTLGVLANARNYEGKASLHLAVEKADVESLTLLDNLGCDPDVGDRSDGKTPLLVAIRARDVVKVDYLLYKLRASPHASAFDQVVPIRVAVGMMGGRSGGNDDNMERIVEMLVDQGATYEAENREAELDWEVVNEKEEEEEEEEEEDVKIEFSAAVKELLRGTPTCASLEEELARYPEDEKVVNLGLKGRMALRKELDDLVESERLSQFISALRIDHVKVPKEVSSSCLLAVLSTKETKLCEVKAALQILEQ